MSEYTLTRSKRRDKKYAFIIDDGSTKTVNFGQTGYEDYTNHHDNDRKRGYISRHNNERKFWTHKKDNLRRAAYLSRFLLWNKPTIKESVRDVEKL